MCTRDAATDTELTKLLTERGYNCTSQRNPWAARFSARRGAPHLAVIDWRIGNQNAAKITANLREVGQHALSSILALVPPGEPETLIEILELGVHDFITLPIDPVKLSTRLSLIEDRFAELEQLKSLQESMREDFHRFLIATGGVGDGVWDLDLETEEIHFSDRWKEMLGYAPDEIEDSLEGWLSLVHPDDLNRLRAVIDASIAGENGVVEQRYRMQTKDQGYRWMLTRGEVVKDVEGRAVRVVGRQSDVDAEDDSREAVRTSGLQDPLTGLPNRSVLLDRLKHAFARAKRDPEQGFAVLFFDLDRFKNVNDSLGHMSGDQLLRAIAQRVEKACRPGDTVARFGGDEFVILVEDIKDIRGATAVSYTHLTLPTS